MLTTLVLVGVPVKPFASAKQRLAAALTPEARIALSREMARLTCGLVVAAGARPLVLAADREVEQWAMEQSIEVSFDAGSNLDRAARSAVDAAAGRPWMILHADLPFLNEEALSIVVELVAGGQSAIAPSRDGGTPLIAASLDAFEFAYGPLSFHRHLRRLASAGPAVIVDPRFAIDLDEPSDLRAARDRLPWVGAVLDTLHRP